MFIPDEIIAEILSYSPDKRFFLINKRVSKIYKEVEKSSATLIRKRFKTVQEVVWSNDQKLIDISIKYISLWNVKHDDYVRISIEALKHDLIDVVKWGIKQLKSKPSLRDELALIFVEALMSSSFYTIIELVKSFKDYDSRYYYTMLVEEGIERQDYDMINYGLSHKKVNYPINNVASHAIVCGSLNVYDFFVNKGAYNFQNHAERVVLYTNDYCKKIEYILTKGNVDILSLIEYCRIHKQQKKGETIYNYLVKYK